MTNSAELCSTYITQLSTTFCLGFLLWVHITCFGYNYCITKSTINCFYLWQLLHHPFFDLSSFLLHCFGILKSVLFLVKEDESGSDLLLCSPARLPALTKMNLLTNMSSLSTGRGTNPTVGAIFYQGLYKTLLTFTFTYLRYSQWLINRSFKFNLLENINILFKQCSYLSLWMNTSSHRIFRKTNYG